MRGRGAHWTALTLEIGLVLVVQAQSPARASVQDYVDRVVRSHPFLGQAVKPLAPRGYPAQGRKGLLGSTE